VNGTFLLLPELVPAGLFPAVRPVSEDIGEFEKLEGRVTCLSVLLPGR
jgi:hypothetical protein